ncbi:MAG: ATP-dependent 6-phosphofructokinase, partial [Clostridia bacterium]|nr:ATP-dependent 6-phosphofructokinase [Clostridia bacterium]
IQRGGSPNARDRETATRMGYFAVKALAEGRTNLVISTRDGGIVETPIEEALQMTKHLQMDRYEVLEAVGISKTHGL